MGGPRMLEPEMSEEKRIRIWREHDQRMEKHLESFALLIDRLEACEALPSVRLTVSVSELQKTLKAVADDIEGYRQGVWDGNDLGWKMIADYAHSAVAKSEGSGIENE